MFSGACRSCLLSVITHTFVFSAFIQGTVREGDCLLLVVVRKADCVEDVIHLC